MPKVARELSALEVRRLKHPGGPVNVTVAAGGVPGLLVQITPSHCKSWVLRTRIAGKRKSIGLGSFGAVGLAEARAAARELLAAIRAGRDPVAERKAARAALRAKITFGQAVDSYLKIKGPELRSPKHRDQWRSTLDTYARPVLGDMLVADIQPADVRRVLQPIWTSKTETASRLRGRIEAVLSWATVAGHREGDNPARWAGNLAELLPKPGRVAKGTHYPAVALSDLPAWWAALRQREGMAARALEFLTLTAARSGEVRGARWSEIDLEAGLWTVPADRMKGGREHRVPLTAEALALLAGLPRDNPLVFPAIRGGMLSDMSISAVMRRMHAAELEAGRPGWLDPRSGRAAVPHGLRSSFRDWCAEAGIDHAVAELALAHSVGSEVERAYRRSDMFERRRAVMQAWAGALAGQPEGAEVVKLRAPAG